jgi:hypothetical protein
MRRIGEIDYMFSKKKKKKKPTLFLGIISLNSTELSAYLT